MAARALLHRFSVDEVEPVPVELIACDAELLVEYKKIDGAEGRLVCRGNRGLVAVDSGIQASGKRRFVIAHELGHFKLHRNAKLFSICDEKAFIDWHGSRPHEKEANVFAAELLMPAPLFEEEARWTQMSADTIERVACTFDVSFTAAAIRYVELDISPSAVVFSQRGEIRWTRVSEDFPYRWIPIGSQVKSFSGAGEYFAEGSTSPEPEETPVEAWFGDDDLPRGKHCFEQCVAMPRYDAVLSLLWKK